MQCISICICMYLYVICMYSGVWGHAKQQPQEKFEILRLAEPWVVIYYSLLQMPIKSVQDHEPVTWVRRTADYFEEIWVQYRIGIVCLQTCIFTMCFQVKISFFFSLVFFSFRTFVRLMMLWHSCLAHPNDEQCKSCPRMLFRCSILFLPSSPPFPK